MPFHIPYHRHTTSDTQYNHDNYYGAANAIYSAGQTLNLVGAANPASLTNNFQRTPTTADQRSYLPLSQPHNSNGNDTVIPYRPGPTYQSAQDAQTSTYSSGLRRSLTIGRSQAEELHMNLNQQSNAMSDFHHYGAPPAYAGEGLSIKIEPSTPQFSPNNSQPGTLQPGGLASRPGPLASSNTAPSLPSLPQISTQLQQPPLSARPSVNHTHSYSRSSPGAMDQPKYKPFTNTPEQSKFPTSQNSYMPQTPSGPSSYSPLGLADIRQRTDLPFADLQFSPNIAQEQEAAQYPQNSNYLAPWPIYAVDWCKWPPGVPSRSGKVAIGSYLEDNHNYVG
jgi:DDB1- and CUL4-associated factor 7